MTDDPPASVADFEARVGRDRGRRCPRRRLRGWEIHLQHALPPEEAARWTALLRAAGRRPAKRERRQSACPSRRTLTRRAKSTAPTAGWCAWASPGLLQGTAAYADVPPQRLRCIQKAPRTCGAISANARQNAGKCARQPGRKTKSRAGRHPNDRAQPEDTGRFESAAAGGRVHGVPRCGMDVIENACAYPTP